MRPKYAVKGQINFHNVSDSKLKEYISLCQSLIYEYKGVDDDKVKVLSAVWKDLTVENTRRLAESPEVTPRPAKMLSKSPKMRKSPLRSFSNR